MAALLIVDRLPSGFSDEELVGLFRPFGPLLSCHLLRDPWGRSLDFGFVEFEALRDAAEAVRALNGKQVDNHSIKVQPKICPPGPHSSEEQVTLIPAPRAVQPIPL
jgi:RNA recognition motif-containing protein